jgi:hypothetical protein
MTRYILSEGDVLRKLKKIQYRSQIPPLLFIAVSFWLSITFGHIAPLRIISLILTALGLIAFFFIALKFRFRNRILAPDAHSIYLPISGKVHEIISEADRQIITISKGRFDPVEIRCPADACIREAGELFLPDEKIRISFIAERIIRIDDARMKAGEVLALMIGKGMCQITIPPDIPLLLKAGDECHAGESRICILKELSLQA